MPESFGRYRIEEKLGQGGMGIVYRAFDTVLERVVALKMVLTADDMESDLRERFFREARAAAHLSHKNIVTIYDLWEQDGRPCLAMEYLAGEDLQHRLAGPEKMSLWRKVDLAIEMSQGMEYAHAHGIVHRDLKPANIFITTGGGVKILDFGLARLASSQLTQSNMLMGTINYLSPEQVRGERADQQSDVFAMGVVLYELFGGRRAFEGNSAAATLYKILQEVPEPLSNVDPSLPRDLISVVDRALAKPRDERYPDMATLRRDLETLRHLAQVAGPASPWPAPPTQLLSGVPKSAPSVREAMASAPTVAQPLPSVAPPPAAKSRMPLIAAAGAIALLSVVSVALWLGRQRAQPPASSAAPSTTVQSSTQSTAAPPPAVTPPIAETPARPTAPSEPDSPTASNSAGAEAARSRMEQSRAAAEAAGARTRVKAAFTKAQRTAQEADRLFRAKQFAEAESRYNVASGLYLGAESAAREATPADSTKPPVADPASRATAPVETKSSAPPAAAPSQPSAPASSPASPPASPPTSTPAPPPPAPAPASGGSSSSLPTTSIATPGASPGAPAGAAEDRIRELIDRYKEALESKNLEQLKRIWPSLKGKQEEGIRDNFQNATSISVAISNPQISVSGTSGRVTFTRHYSLVTVDRQRPQSTDEAVMDVRRIGGTWVIESIQFTSRKLN